MRQIETLKGKDLIELALRYYDWKLNRDSKLAEWLGFPITPDVIKRIENRIRGL